MKELKDILGIVADGLKSFSGSIGVLAGMIDEVAGKIKVDEAVQKEPAEKAESIKPPVKKTKRSAAKKTVDKPAKKSLPSAKSDDKNNKTSAGVVLALLNQANEGLNAAEVMAKTGYDKKKVANIFYRLKAKGDIWNNKKGVYYCNSIKRHDQKLSQAK